MKKPELPKIDSVAELAEFWDTHDLIDFEDELEDVSDQVFAHTHDALTLSLDQSEAKEIERIANENGVSREQLVRGWVRQHISQRNGG